MEEIEFNKKNFHTCLCPDCPVQAKSNCVQIKINPIKGSKDMVMPNPKGVPGLYCTTGTATCTDIDPDKACQCPKCDIWEEHNLGGGKPGKNYCVNGSTQ